MRWFRQSQSESDEIQQLCESLMWHPDPETADELAAKGPKVVLPLLTALDDRSGDFWDAAMYTIRKIGKSATPDLSVALLISPKPEIRANAATGIGLIQASRAAVFLVATLSNRGECEEVWLYSAEALGMVGNRIARDALNQLRTHSRYPASVQQAMLHALKMLSGGSPPPGIEPSTSYEWMYRTHEFDYSQSEIKLMQQHRDVDGLIKALKSSTMSIQHYAIEALGELGDAHAIPALVDMLPWHGTSVVEALSKISDPCIISPLLETLLLSPPWTGAKEEQVIKEVMARIGAERVRPVVEQSLNDLEPYFRMIEESYKRLRPPEFTFSHPEVTRHQGLLEFFARNVGALKRIFS